MHFLTVIEYLKKPRYKALCLSFLDNRNNYIIAAVSQTLHNLLKTLHTFVLIHLSIVYSEYILNLY